MEKIIAIYMRQAIRSDRTTVYNAIKESGNPKLAEYIRRM
jgi:DNA-binding phage protein